MAGPRAPRGRAAAARKRSPPSRTRSTNPAPPCAGARAGPACAGWERNAAPPRASCRAHWSAPPAGWGGQAGQPPFPPADGPAPARSFLTPCRRQGCRRNRGWRGTAASRAPSAGTGARWRAAPVVGAPLARRPLRAGSWPCRGRRRRRAAGCRQPMLPPPAPTGRPDGTGQCAVRRRQTAGRTAPSARRSSAPPAPPPAGCSGWSRSARTLFRKAPTAPAPPPAPASGHPS